MSVAPRSVASAAMRAISSTGMDVPVGLDGDAVITPRVASVHAPASRSAVT